MDLRSSEVFSNCTIFWNNREIQQYIKACRLVWCRQTRKVHRNIRRTMMSSQSYWGTFPLLYCGPESCRYLNNAVAVHLNLCLKRLYGNVFQNLLLVTFSEKISTESNFSFLRREKNNLYQHTTFYNCKRYVWHLLASEPCVVIYLRW